jgi:5-methylcytosine-specific restriction protein A
MAMANKALTPCKRAGCAALVRGGYCDKHKPPPPPRRESDAWHGWYGTQGWKSTRAAQLLREPYCRVCAGRGYRTRATEVDHVTPHRGDRTLFYDESNLQSLCHRCHSVKTMTEMNARRQQPTPTPEMF